VNSVTGFVGKSAAISARAGQVDGNANSAHQRATEGSWRLSWVVVSVDLAIL